MYIQPVELFFLWLLICFMWHMDSRTCSTSTPTLNREDSAASLRSRPKVPPLTGLVLYSSQRILQNPSKPGRPPNLRTSASTTSFLRRAESSSGMRCYPNPTPLCNGLTGSANSASYPSINKIHFSSLTSSPRSTRSPAVVGGSNSSTATGSPVPPASATPSRWGDNVSDQRSSSPRVKLAMLNQVKGYLENLKTSVDSIKDEMWV